MKRRFMKFYFIATLFCCLFFPALVFAENPAPPPPSGHSTQGDQNPKGAPIDGGLGILLALGAGYGGYKGYRLSRKKKAEEEIDMT